ncbi:MAG: helix-hairpin-helix domain-containing protein [Syntrophales bacterium]|nr:helix-hairpin-helix domain-containing protein [Syntrophales bacterium]
MSITDRQLDGSIVLVAIASFVYIAVSLLARYPSHGTSIPYSDGGSCPVIAELTGDTDHRGIYFVPEDTTISDFLKIAEVENISDLEKKTVKLSTGVAVTINAGNQLSMGKMGAAKRLLLDIPIDINLASPEDLMLVPGIGEKTAQRIIHLRETSGRLQGLEDLMKIPGIKEKRLARIKKYLYVEGVEN